MIVDGKWRVLYFKLPHFCGIIQNLLHLLGLGMNTKLIYSTVTDVSLYLDEATLEEIKNFIQTFIGDSWQGNPRLCIFISTAIVCECKRLPAIQSQLNVPFGFNVEKLIKGCPEINKEQFLNNIISVAQKWPTCPPQFLHKLENLKLGFRIFKKYRQSCKAIGQRLGIDYSNNYLISSLFWLIYLIAKHLNNESDSLEIVTTVVPFLIHQAYISYLQAGQRQVVQECIAKFFALPDFANQSLKLIHERYHKQFSKILSESYSRRYLAEVTNFNFLLYKSSVLERLIDDLSNIYSKGLEDRPQFSIDEMSFLDLKKDMTPEGFHQKIDKTGIIISEKISFDGEKGPAKQAHTPKATPNRIANVEETPLTMRMQNLSWIRNNIQNLEQYKFGRVQACYQKYNPGNFKQFYDKVSAILERIVIEFSPACKDIRRRKSQIYKFFAYCINIAIDMYNEEIKKIFATDLPLLSIFCLCTQVFNFVYQTYNGQYSRYCQIFQVDQLNAFWPINWFGFFIKLPKTVDDHLYQLQRKFLLKQIWYTDLGYKIITNHEEVVRINELRMLQRLQQHIRCRIDEICRETIGERMIKKVYNMVIQLIEKKPFLLKRNNIDQIIICSITASLSINQDINKVSLEKVFSFYQRVSLSSQENKEKLYDKDQKQLNIVDFYNHVFLEELQEIIHKFPTTSNFLLTPKRLQFSEKYKQGIEMTPLRQKYKESDSAFLKKRTDGQNTGNYQLNLARSIKMESQAPMQSESDEDSMQDEKKP